MNTTPDAFGTTLQRIAILDDYQGCVPSLHAFDVLRSREVTVFQDTLREPDALVRRLRDFDALVVLRERTPLPASVLARLPRLRLVCSAGAFPGVVDLDACGALGIAAAQGAGTGAPTAELCWALVLASRRQLLAEAQALRAGRWQGHLGQGLQGQVLGIWGYGRVGRQVARYGQAFGMRVRVWGSERARRQAVEDGCEVAASREALFADADVLSLHLRLVPETRGAVALADLLRMKPGALLVNTSRAELIAEGALVQALRQGRPGFAAIDVFEDEPMVDTGHPLLALPNVLATPHIGFVERDNYEAYYRAAFDHLRRFEAGETGGFLCHPQAAS